MSVTKVPGTAEWMVKYKRLVGDSFTVEEETIRATHVIIGAGALGSTKLLLRSREQGLNVYVKKFQVSKNMFRLLSPA